MPSPHAMCFLAIGWPCERCRLKRGLATAALVPREVRALEQGTGCNAGMVHQRLLRAAAQLSGSMISVDATRCACCGACISVCPLDALEQRRYEQEWAAGIGRRMARNYRLRARFRPHQRVGERFMRLFALTMRVAL